MNKKNNRLIFKVFFLFTTVIILSSCAREKASWSHHNEKLRKQSLEIENSIPGSSLSMEEPEQKAIVASEEIGVKNPEINPEKNSFSAPVEENKIKEKKLNPVQKLALKKLAKKMSPEELAKIEKSHQLDQNLKYAIIFGVVGVILYILGGISYVFWILGTIAIVVGLVFLLLWILEQ